MGERYLCKVDAGGSSPPSSTKTVKRYRIKKSILLGFLTPQQQCEVFLSEGELESDGSTIWLLKDGERHETTTVGWAVAHWLEQGRIEETSAPDPA